MQHNNLESYMRNMFNMKVMYHFSIPEMENMYPWERDVYIDLIKEKQKKEEQVNG